jgi:CDP-diacylglycerol--glycerol-3-phosphate 3-phosphatidyltransferase
VLVVAFASDALDGYLARRLGQTSELGALLDSVADFAIYLTIPLVGWWLWPDIIRREAPYFTAVIASTILSPMIGYGKFRTCTSYHTWAAKLAAFLVGSSVILLFAGWLPCLFRLVTPVCVYAAMEEIAITLALPKSQPNVRSFWHIMRKRADHRDCVF